MRKGKASRTAQFITYNRALGTLAPEVPGFSDPLAVRFLPAKWQAKIARAGRKGQPAYPFWLRGMGLFNQFRTVVFDRAIGEAAPVEQLVILGAGFDTRAWRLDTLREAVVFEVDHPDTQRVKQERAAGIPLKAREVRFVATDFHEGDLARLLRAAGFDGRRPACWLWEGVTMYLRAEAVAANLGTFAALSAPGSRLTLTYMRKDGDRVPRSLFLALMGEPVRSGYSPAEITDVARRYGWECRRDSGIEDWMREIAPGLRLTKRQAGMQWFERIWTGTLAGGHQGA